MTLDELKEYLRDTASILNADTLVSDREAEIRAGKCLEALYKIGVASHAVETELLKCKSIATVTFAKVLTEDTVARNITEKKALAQANNEFVSATEAEGSLEAELNFLKAMAKVFENGHVFYRRKFSSSGNSY